MSTPESGRSTTLTVQEEADVKDLLGRIGSTWWWLLALGILSLLAGIAVLAWPKATIVVVAFLFGIWLLVEGVFSLVRGFGDRLDGGSRALLIISGILMIILGLMAFRSITQSIEILLLFIGIGFILRGMLELFAGIAAPKGTDGRGWLVFLGILGVVAGIVVLVWPVSTVAALVLLLGIWLIVIGLFEIVGAFMVRSAAKKVIAAIS